MFWNSEVLTRIDAADDLKIAPYHPDMNTTGTPTWIWEVKVDNRLFVRAYSGTRSKWYQAALSQQAGKILAIFPGLPVKMLALFLLVLVIPLKAAISKEKSHIRTLVIVSHPYPERSVMIKGLQQAAESVDGVTVRNLETLYGFDTRKINGDEERRITRQNDRIVFIFPTHFSGGENQPAA